MRKLLIILLLLPLLGNSQVFVHYQKKRIPAATVSECGYNDLVLYGKQTYHTIGIGTQTWLKESLSIGNFIHDYQFPSGAHCPIPEDCFEYWCYLDCGIYGGLYAWDEAMNYVTTDSAVGICPTGWHIPSLAEYNTLFAFLGGTHEAGGKMKSTGVNTNAHAYGGAGLWNEPNTGATNSSCFTSLPAWFLQYTGVHNESAPSINEGTSNYLWTSTEGSSGNAWSIVLSYDTDSVLIEEHVKTDGLSVRCIKDVVPIVDTLPPIVTTYGYLYNWYAATSSDSIANVGWKVPSEDDMIDLRIYLDPLHPSRISVAGNTAGEAMKVTGTVFWNSPNYATNTSNLNFKAAGVRSPGVGFSLLGAGCWIWNSTSVSPAYGGNGTLYNNTVLFQSCVGNSTDKRAGTSIRLMKRTTTLTNGQTGTYTGNDGRVYSTVCVGTQEWMSENLKETKYRNGNLIPNVSDELIWAGLVTGALCTYIE